MSKKKYFTPTADIVRVENDVLLAAISGEDINADAKKNDYVDGATWDDDETSANETKAWSVWGDD